MKARQSGTAIVEFALILPLLLLLIFVVVEAGRAMYEYGVITKSVRDAARYMSLQTEGEKLNEGRNLVVFGNTAGSGAPVLPGLNLAMVAAPSWSTAGSDPVITVVSIEVSGYTFTPMMESFFGLSLGPIPFSDISATMRSAL
jgi:hypothetical protein